MRSNLQAASLRLFVAAFALGATARLDAQDTLRLHADNPPLWGPTVALTRVLAIGGIDGPPEYAFGRIDAFAARSDGTFFVYDGQDTQVRMYDPAGKFVKNVGRKGSGPGEYVQVSGMGVLGDSLLVTWDQRSSRLSYFDKSGTYTTSVTLGFGIATSKPFAVDIAGRLYVKTWLPRRVAPGEEELYCYVRVKPDGTIIDSIPIPPRNAAPGFVVEVGAEGERWNFMTSTVATVYPPGGVVSGRSDRYALSLTVAGKPAVIERQYTPVPMRAEERAEWEAMIRDSDAARVRRGAVPPSRPPIPDVKPPFRGLASDLDGRIWVEVYTAAVKRPRVETAENAKIRSQITWREPTTFDVIARDGQYLGRVTLPPNSLLLAARGNRIWVQTTGADDEQTIVAYRLTGRGLQ